MFVYFITSPICINIYEYIKYIYIELGAGAPLCAQSISMLLSCWDLKCLIDRPPATLLNIIYLYETRNSQCSAPSWKFEHLVQCHLKGPSRVLNPYCTNVPRFPMNVFLYLLSFKFIDREIYELLPYYWMNLPKTVGKLNYADMVKTLTRLSGNYKYLKIISQEKRIFHVES